MEQIFPWRYQNLTADGQVLGGPGILHALVINKPATTAGVVTLYDSLTETGDIIASITIGTAAERQRPTTLIFDCAVETGLYVGFDGTIVAADVTAIFM